MKITNEVLEAYLNCKTKVRLKLAGESGTPSDYEAMTTAARQASREEAIAKLMARFADASRGVLATAETLEQGNTLLAKATLEDDALSIRFDALKRAEGASKLGDHHYVPVLHINSFTVSVTSVDQSGEEASVCVVASGRVGPARCVRACGWQCGVCG
jgi:hypothetical protein